MGCYIIRSPNRRGIFVRYPIRVAIRISFRRSRSRRRSSRVVPHNTAYNSRKLSGACNSNFREVWSSTRSLLESGTLHCIHYAMAWFTINMSVILETVRPRSIKFFGSSYFDPGELPFRCRQRCTNTFTSRSDRSFRCFTTSAASTSSDVRRSQQIK